MSAARGAAGEAERTLPGGGGVKGPRDEKMMRHAFPAPKAGRQAVRQWPRGPAWSGPCAEPGEVARSTASRRAACSELWRGIAACPSDERAFRICPGATAARAGKKSRAERISDQQEALDRILKAKLAPVPDLPSRDSRRRALLRSDHADARPCVSGVPRFTLAAWTPRVVLSVRASSAATCHGRSRCPSARAETCDRAR